MNENATIAERPSRPRPAGRRERLPLGAPEVRPEPVALAPASYAPTAIVVGGGLGTDVAVSAVEYEYLCNGELGQTKIVSCDVTEFRYDGRVVPPALLRRHHRHVKLRLNRENWKRLTETNGRAIAEIARLIDEEALRRASYDTTNGTGFNPLLAAAGALCEWPRVWTALAEVCEWLQRQEHPILVLVKSDAGGVGRGLGCLLRGVLTELLRTDSGRITFVGIDLWVSGSAELPSQSYALRGEFACISEAAYEHRHGIIVPPPGDEATASVVPAGMWRRFIVTGDGGLSTAVREAARLIQLLRTPVGMRLAERIRNELGG